MNLSSHLAKHFRDVHFGGNWTAVNLKDTLADISLEEAGTRVGSLNTILALVYHINYYVTAILKVLNGSPLDASDKYSYDHPGPGNEAEWQQLLQQYREQAENFAAKVEQLPDEMIWANFSDGKYGNYYRNIQGLIEHTHYHLGQISLVKKMIREQKAASGS